MVLTHDERDFWERAYLAWLAGFAHGQFRRSQDRSAQAEALLGADCAVEELRKRLPKVGGPYR